MSVFSYSQLRIYKECPRRFKLLRVDKYPVEDNAKRALLGNVLGALVERMYVESWWAKPGLLDTLRAELHTMLRVHEQLDGIVWEPGEQARWLQIAESTLPKIVQTMRDEKLLGQVCHAELDIEFPLYDDRIVGRIDYAFEGPGLTVVDGKAGATMGKFVSPDQLRLYAVGAYARWGRLPDRIGFWWFRHARVVWKKMNAASLTTFLHGLAATVARVKARDYGPTPGVHCKYCEVRKWCPEGQAHVRTVPMLDGISVDEGIGVVSL